MPQQIANTLAKTAFLLFLAIFISYPQLQAYASGLTTSSGPTDSNHSTPIDYSHMALYELKKNRDHTHSIVCSPGNKQKNEAHDDTHQGCRDQYIYMVSSYLPNNLGIAETLFFLALEIVAVIIIKVTINSFLYAVWPSLGAASLTAIELPENSLWKITGSNAVRGRAIRYSDLAFNEDAITHAREYQMYDWSKAALGRFLLIDQENWWGIVGYPVDVDVTFTRFDEVSGEAMERVTVNVQRKITNGMKAGAIASRIVRSTKNLQNYQLVTRTDYPGWFDFDSWQHQPVRLMVDFK